MPTSSPAHSPNHAMRVLHTREEMGAARADLRDVGLVPTMGFLHDGHLSLVARARAERASVVATIFVNPTQFGPGEDLARYPRNLERDLALLDAAGVDIVFVPDAAEIYPSGFNTRVEVLGVTDVLEGAIRPGHFSGVATVVTKLFNIIRPNCAYFGQKDAQQSIVIRKLVADLDLPIEVIIAPTVREPDGLALSSRNSYLTPAQRKVAPIIFQALSKAKALFDAGETDAEVLRRAERTVLEAEPDIKIDYISIASAQTLRELMIAEPGALASMAVRLGSTRLIDNLLLGEACTPA